LEDSSALAAGVTSISEEGPACESWEESTAFAAAGNCSSLVTSAPGFGEATHSLFVFRDGLSLISSHSTRSEEDREIFFGTPFCALCWKSRQLLRPLLGRCHFFNPRTRCICCVGCRHGMRLRPQSVNAACYVEKGPRRNGLSLNNCVISVPLMNQDRSFVSLYTCARLLIWGGSAPDKRGRPALVASCRVATPPLSLTRGRLAESPGLSQYNNLQGCRTRTYFIKLRLA
jgi:hypothetical protein